MASYKRAKSWAFKSQSSARMDVIAKHAAPYLEVGIEELDNWPLKFNVRNGTLIFEEFGGKWHARLARHDPADLITMFSDIEYDPEATCPTYDEAFALVQPDPAVRSFLHRAIGYACTGDVSEQKVFFFYGAGRNGKSTFIEVWARILGDYSTTIPIERFLHAGNSGDGAKPSPDLARLHGVRMLRTSEPERGAKLAESLIKLTTSGEPLLVRHLNRPFFQLRPQFKLFISGNYKPMIRGTDDGIWRRLILIPWDVKLTDANCDPHLADKLAREGSGILNRLIAGTLDWLNNGLSIPPGISDATTEYRQSSDHLGRFLAECASVAPSSRVPANKLFGVYCAWARATGAPLWKQSGFGRAMIERGYRNTKSGTHFWLGIELLKEVTDFQEADPQQTDDPPSHHHDAAEDDDISL